MQSNVGDPRVYEDGDQRLPKETGPQRGAREREERLHSVPGQYKHEADSSKNDVFTAEGRLSTSQRQDYHDHILEENQKTVIDPLRPAMDHGNKPSRGAQIDKELQMEDEALLRKKEKAE